MEYPHVVGIESTGYIAEVGDGVNSCIESPFGTEGVMKQCVPSPHRGHWTSPFRGLSSITFKYFSMFFERPGMNPLDRLRCRFARRHSSYPQKTDVL